MVHRSIRVGQEMWDSIEQKARDRHFESTQSYIRHVLQEDLEGKRSLDDLEDRLVASISKVAARVTSLGTMFQAIFAVVWEIAEEQIRCSPAMLGKSPLFIEHSIAEFRQRVAGQIRKKPELKELMDGANEEAPQTATATH
jgi:Arc/MetJ-type ribon-helix-helix transcriptional regulator